MPLFPPGAPVTVVIDGRPLAAYVRAYVAGGRVFAPVAPLLTRLADQFWFDGETLVVQRKDRRVRIRLVPQLRGQLTGAFVPAGPVLRALGAMVCYESAHHRLDVSLSARNVVTSPTPFNPIAPSASPNAVFTSTPAATPRPLWTGSPMPRRTALPLSQPPLRPGIMRQE